MNLNQNLQHLKDRLEAEKTTVESELAQVARINPDLKGDWEAVQTETEDPADEEDVAEALSNFEDNSIVAKELERQLEDINTALQKIEDGKFGTCDVCSEPIEEDRLEANPSAKTCKAHL